MTERLAEKRGTPHLRLSNLGDKCSRKLWLQQHYPESEEKLSASTRLKFLFGDVIELLVLFLAKLAGHTVEGQQDELEIAGIRGHRDAVIDGVTVDVKSASSFSFEKFKYHLTPATDSFGYIPQLGSYLQAGQTDPIVRDKDRAGFLVVDKTLGHITLDLHPKQQVNYEELAEKRKAELALTDMPVRGYSDRPIGASGNRELGIECSYCPVRARCWPGLRSFAYSGGIKHLTVVKREPDVPELHS